jgi:hypothetical protein
MLAAPTIQAAARSLHGILYICQGMVPKVQQPTEGGCSQEAFGHPFLAVGGVKEASQAPIREHVTPFNPASHLPVARWGLPCSPPGALWAYAINRAHGAEEKS